MPSEPTNAGIVLDDESGQREIPESRRADGTTRKAIKIRPGYRPPEDVEVYKNRTAESFRTRSRAAGVPGAAGLREPNDENAKPEGSSSASSNKNAKRREARKRAKAAGDDGEAEVETPAAAGKAVGKTAGKAPVSKAATGPAAPVEEIDEEAEKEKKARTLKKKLRQAKDLKDKKEGGLPLLPEQIAKVIKINEIIRELDALGFDAEGEPKVTDKAKVKAKD